MLSIDECRALIPDGDKMSDEEISALRKDLYEMAELALECYFLKKGGAMQAVPATPSKQGSEKGIL